MFSHIEYQTIGNIWLYLIPKKKWTDTSASGTAITAASLNNIENGIGNATSQINKMMTATNVTGIKFTIDDGREFSSSSMKVGNLIFLDFDCSCGDFSSWEVWNIGTAPKPVGNTWAMGHCMLQNGSAAPVPLYLGVTSDGTIRVQNKSGAVAKGGWIFGKVVYVCV